MRKNSEKNRQASPGSDWERGRVAAVHRERFELWTQSGSVYARMKRGLRLSGQDMPTVGDVVFFSGGSGGDGVIQQIAPRSSFSPGWIPGTGPGRRWRPISIGC